MQEIHWGMIGCGAVTEVKSGPAFQNIEGAQLVAVMCRTPEKVKDYAARHGVPKWYTDADRLIHDPDVNAIYVATPPAFHKEYALWAAAAGKPIYVEKPMGLDHKECLEMIAACEKARVPLFIAYYRRRLPAFLKVKELVDAEAIGSVRFVLISLHCPPRPEDLDHAHPPWRGLPEIGGGGYFVDMGCHQLDYLDYIFGPIVSAQGLAANRGGLYPAEDTVCADFRFESGVLGCGSWCFTVSPEGARDRIEIVGSKGRIVFPTFDAGPVRLETATGIRTFDLPPPQNIQQPLIQTVVDELRGLGKCPSTGVTAARTTRVMDEILRDWRTVSSVR